MFFQLDYDILYLPVRKCTKNQWNADEKENPKKLDFYESRPLDRTWKKCSIVDADGDELKNSY